jgi:type II secretory ATPase GspE/PulE/Tfp pilus assembly ATPase PilB-like protein
VHFDPFHDEVEVRFRIDGRLEHYCRLSEEVARQLLSQFKVMANLDLNEHFSPQDGRLELPVEFSEIDVRVTTARAADGEAAALRILPRNQLIRPLDQLGLSTSSSAGLDLLRAENDGLVLVAGPTGAGKTTTAYSMINHLDDGRHGIVTIEDPIEYRVPSFTQMEVDPRHGITFAEGVKTALRMDPDIILLGEIRDAETAMAAMRASSCGKHVFSTFHARDAAAAMAALRDFGVTAKSLAGNLRGIISQRLVRRVCAKCHSETSVNAKVENLFKAFDLEPPAQLLQANGCVECHQTGYRDRIGVFEVAINTPELAEAIEDDWSELQLHHLLREQRTPSLASDALQKVREGITTLDEVRTMTWVNFLAGTMPTRPS